MSEVDHQIRWASPKIYEAIASEGDEELNRPFKSLMWLAFGGFSYVVAGSYEAFLVMFTGDIALSQGFGYLIAAGLGNIVGGMGLFAFMAYAQIKKEEI